MMKLTTIAFLNPYLNKLKEESHNLTNLRLSQTIQAHGLPISRFILNFDRKN